MSMIMPKPKIIHCKDNPTEYKRLEYKSQAYSLNLSPLLLYGSLSRRVIIPI